MHATGTSSVFVTDWSPSPTIKSKWRISFWHKPSPPKQGLKAEHSKSRARNVATPPMEKYLIVSRQPPQGLVPCLISPHRLEALEEDDTLLLAFFDWEDFNSRITLKRKSVFLMCMSSPPSLQKKRNVVNAVVVVPKASGEKLDCRWGGRRFLEVGLGCSSENLNLNLKEQSGRGWSFDPLMISV